MIRSLVFGGAILLTLAGCSETPIEEQSPQARADVEKQIEMDAKSLEQAADEAVQILEQETAEQRPAPAIGEGVVDTDR